MRRLRVGALIAAAALTLSFAGTALAVTYATVDGHAPASADSNHASYWETDGLTCEKIYDGGGDEIYTWAADQDYARVIVKAGGRNVGDFANTIFDDVSAGELVFADSNGSGTSDPGGRHGDKYISHIIVCEAAETETTTTETETTETETTDTTTTSTASTDTETTEATTTDETTPEGSVEELTPPRTDAFTQPTATSSVPTSVLLVLAGLLAAALVVIPAAARRR